MIETPVNPTIPEKGHPPALFILFFTEMWERFAYYLMVGILLLYLIDSTTGGKGFAPERGADIVAVLLPWCT